jgi:hypothetical protein
MLRINVWSATTPMPDAITAVPERAWVAPPDDICPSCREPHALYREGRETRCVYCVWWEEARGA